MRALATGQLVLPGVANALILAFAFATTGAAQTSNETVQPVVTLRDAGYLLGDLLDEHIELDLPRGVALDPDSLPLPGRVAPWLEVRQAQERASDRGANVKVTYQIFAEVEQASRVPIPAFKLRLREGKQTRMVTVPEKSFLLSPALPASLGDEDRELRPSPLPQPLPRAPALAVFLASLLAALLCAAYLLWAHDRLPFLPRAPGPFARLWRRWRRRRGELVGDEHLALLRDWHGALNQAAGETLYASTLPRLFTRAPFLAPLRERVERTFAQSWRSFYGVPGEARPAAGEIFDLAREAAARERGVPC